MGYSLRRAASFVLVRGLLSSCGVQVFSSLVVACRLCSCGVWVPERVGSVVCGIRAL